MRILITFLLSILFIPSTAMAMERPVDICVKYKTLNESDAYNIHTGMESVLKPMYKDEVYIDMGSCFHATSWSGRTTINLYSTEFQRKQTIKNREYLQNSKKEVEKSASDILASLIQQGLVSRFDINNL